MRPPLVAYSIEVAGSIAGSLLFALVSCLGSPPGVWFALAALGVLALPPAPSPSGSRALWARGGRGGQVRVLNAGLLLRVIVGVSVLGRTSSWSPYYRIDVQPRPGHGWALFVNNIGHQEVAPYAMRVRRSIFYMVPFKTFHFPPSTRELIIGAGSGSDADIAYYNGIRHITAVEIDPTIYDLGRRLHPDHIYSKPGVHVVIDDGRAFLERTQGTYNLIVFALPDSLALTSSFANLRLESYLFTREAFAAARRHLSPNSVLVLYNYYRQAWVMHKIDRHRLTYRYGSFIRPEVIVIVQVNGTMLIGISEPTTVVVVCPVTLLPVVVTYAVILVHCPEDVVEYLAMS